MAWLFSGRTPVSRTLAESCSQWRRLLHHPKGGGGKIHATGGLSDLAKESVTNVSAVIKKLTGKDISDYDIHIQFVDTHGVDGDSASITIATAINFRP